MIVFDSTFLLLLLSENTPTPIDPATGQPLARCKDRVEHLIATISKAGDKIIIPTPSLAEALVHAGEAAERFFTVIRTSRYFQVTPFGTTAAIEAAEIMRKRIALHGRLTDAEVKSRAKIKFDIQILAIANVSRAAALYTDDRDLQKLAKAAGLSSQGFLDLPLPPEDDQQSLDLPPPGQQT